MNKNDLLPEYSQFNVVVSKMDKVHWCEAKHDLLLAYNLYDAEGIHTMVKHL
jgi:hypothetical protein